MEFFRVDGPDEEYEIQYCLRSGDAEVNGLFYVPSVEIPIARGLAGTLRLRARPRAGGRDWSPWCEAVP